MTDSVYLLRHGRVENPDGVLYGTLPGFPLSERGRRGVLALAEEMRGAGVKVSRVIHSPALRAKQTAEIVAAVFGAPLSEDARLFEWGMGPWVGKPVREFRERSGYFATPMRTEGMEPLEDMAARVVAAIEDARQDDGMAVLVSHREPLASAILALSHGSMKRIHEVDLPVASSWEIRYTDAASPTLRKAFDHSGDA